MSDTEDFDPDDAHLELVMPFVVCRSNGGPFDDDAFVAGVVFGTIQAKLRERPVQFQEMVSALLAPQLDLLAMHCGYTLKCEPWPEHPDEWVLATFDLVSVDA